MVPSLLVALTLSTLACHGPCGAARAHGEPPIRRGLCSCSPAAVRLARTVFRFIVSINASPAKLIVWVVASVRRPDGGLSVLVVFLIRSTEVVDIPSTSIFHLRLRLLYFDLTGP